MTYAPAPYAAPVQMTDPTNVMGRRIGAYFIDVVVPSVIAVIVGFSIWLSSASRIDNVPTNYCTDVAHPGHSCLQSGSTAYLATNSVTSRAIVVGVLIWLLAPLNAIVLQGITGATVGKYMFGLRVVRADGSIAGFGWVLLRSFLFIVDNMCFALVGLISSSVTHPHRRVGDMAAGTFVVGKQSVGRAVAAYPAYAATPAPYGYSYPQPSAYGPPPGSYAPPPAATAPWTPPPNGAPSDTPAVGTGAAESPSASGWAAPESPSASGWAAPENTQPLPASTPAPTEQWRPPPAAYAAPPPPVQDPTEPHWDPARNAWIAWEPTRGQWMQFDANGNEWRAM